ncbi:SMC family ATPase [Geodermatophilaceae bacterium NBWT11]|nr:SMC family ATPase [Geodermatophilaceae bacterium NBWT11]
MRVHQLSVRAFGPFAGEVSVDLDEKGADGLFLLWGPTGAGKTSLLDAIVFALYGTVPGVRGHEKRLRSDHAGVDVRTEVRCEVTLGGERLRITRRPEQQRPKKRGTGSTIEQATLTVQRLTDGGWEPVSTRIDEGSEHLRTRLGLSAEQFCQVVLLPQGDFARFLRAEPDDRGRLLRTLFDVGRFARAEDWLAEERRQADELTRAARTAVGTVLARVAQVADVDVPEDLAPDLVGAAGAGVDRWVAEVLADAREDSVESAAAADAARAQLDLRETEAAAARSLAERHTRRDRARRELDGLTAGAADLESARETVEAARRAEPLRDVLEDVEHAGRAAERAAADLDVAQAAWTAVADGAPADTLTARALRDEAAAARALEPEVARAAGLRRSADALDREADVLASRVLEAEERCAARPAEQAAAEAALARATDAQSRRPGLAAALARLTDVAAASVAADRAGRELASAEAAVLAAREGLVGARERAADLRAARLEGMAAELASTLAAGDDCPVCGSLEHPRPAEHVGTVVTAAEEDDARAAVERSEHDLHGALETQGRWTTEVAAAVAISDGVGTDTAAAAREEARVALAEADAAAAGLGRAQRGLEAFRERAEDEDRQVVLDRAALASRTAERDATRAAHAELTEVLTRATGDDHDLASRVRRLERQADRCDAVVDAVAMHLRARGGLAAAEGRASSRAAEAGFADVAEAAAALLERGELRRLDGLLRDHDRALEAARSALAAPDLVDLGAAPDEAATGEALRSATANREAAVAVAVATSRRLVDLESLVGALTTARIRLDERRAHADHVGSLADLVTGRGANTRKMRLQSFVLAARLEQVAEVASSRLQEMSGGRYTFLHSDAVGRHGARGGLGLDVLDEYTGVRRPTKTLSGGESFMASLALALGLADVVTAESGGVQIDTLFVDEGFGSLDPRALDAVMTVLDDLRRGGRVVGVVSHVEELRTRIPSRIEVLAGRDGSRLAG